LYFADRGVRPLGRAGAFVAGGDDLGAMAYNPAGIYDAGGQFLIDGSWLHFTSDYTRQALLPQFDPNTHKQVGEYVETYPSVQGSSPVLPIPTIGLSLQPHPQWVIALGIWAPNAAIASYPEVTDEGKPAPQRYSLINIDGSLLSIVSLTAAFAPSKELRFGASLQALVGKFRSLATFSGCIPERFFCAPEEPSWDVRAELSVSPIFTPSGNLGAVWAPSNNLRVGASFQLPFYVRAPATLKTRLPSTPVFEKASQDGQDASVAFDIPWTARLGIEVRPVADLRIEAGFAYDKWSMLDAINVTPDGVALTGVAGFPKRYLVPSTSLQKGFQDAFSLRIGGEYSFPLFGYTWEARTGVSYESGAIPNELISVQTLDLPKVTAALGGSLHIGKFRFDATYAHIFAFDATVDPHDARITQVSPVQAAPAKTPDYVNGGTYSARADVFGVGLAYTFGAPSPDHTWSSEAKAWEKKGEKKPDEKKPDDAKAAADKAAAEKAAADKAAEEKKAAADKAAEEKAAEEKAAEEKAAAEKAAADKKKPKGKPKK
jgi:long-chain fatty acid transport protein